MTHLHTPRLRSTANFPYNYFAFLPTTLYPHLTPPAVFSFFFSLLVSFLFIASPVFIQSLYELQRIMFQCCNHNHHTYNQTQRSLPANKPLFFSSTASKPHPNSTTSPKPNNTIFKPVSAKYFFFEKFHN